MGIITFTRTDFESRRQHLQQQQRMTQQEIQRLQGQYQAIDGALQDVDFWESKLDALEAEQKATDESAAVEQKALAEKLDVALAHQEGLNDAQNAKPRVSTNSSKKNRKRIQQQ